MKLLQRLRRVVDPLAAYRRTVTHVVLGAPSAEVLDLIAERRAQLDKRIVSRGNRHARRALAKVLR